tara:strand:- start:453 stop:557 length:105 start_codon:yes stop_codon:yes gene_type:complete
MENKNYEIVVCSNCGETKLKWEIVCPKCKKMNSK